MLDKNIIIPLLLSLFAGLSTVLGAFLVFFSRISKRLIITFSLAFSSGVMLSISLLDLFISSENYLTNYLGKTKGIVYSLLFMLIGVLISFLISNLISEESSTKNKEKNRLFKIGLTSMLALMLHNFPEGIATFVSGYENLSLGISVAFAITLHNIPEGIAIAIPIYHSTNSKFLAFKYTFLSGISEPLGALFAFLIIKPYINEFIMSIIFLLVSGIMLYISLVDLLPTAKSYNLNKVFTLSLFLGVIFIPLSHIFI